MFILAPEIMHLFDTIESIKPTSVEAKVSLTLKDQGISKKVVVNWTVSLSRLNANLISEELSHPSKCPLSPACIFA